MSSSLKDNYRGVPTQDPLVPCTGRWDWNAMISRMCSESFFKDRVFELGATGKTQIEHKKKLFHKCGTLPMDLPTYR